MMLARIFLLLLCTFYSSLGTEYSIDWNQCGKATNCFVRESCTSQSNAADAILLQFTDSSQLKNGNCDVVIQIRPYSATKWFVMMQVNSTKSIDGNGVLFNQNVMQFSCLKNGPKGNTDIFEIESVGKVKYEDKLVFCSFTLKTKDNSDIFEGFKKNDKNPTLEFNQNKLEYAGDGWSFWTKVDSKCNPEKITTSEISDDFLQDKIKPFAYPPIKCEDPSKSLIITRPTKDPVVLETTDQLVCHSSSWRYKSEIINKNEEFNVACGVRFCSLCTPLDPLTCPGCTEPTNTTVKSCMILSCPTKDWKMEDGKLWKGEMECKKETGNANSKNAYWYRKGDTDAEKVIKAACFNKEVCWDAANIKNLTPEECPAVNEKCINLVKPADSVVLNCSEGVLSHFLTSGNVSEAATAKCDYSTGLYVDNNQKTIASGSTVYCAVKKESADADQPAAANLGAITIYAGAGVAAFLLILAIVIIAVCLVRRKRAAAKKKAAMPRTVQLDGSLETPSKATERDSVKDEAPSTVASVKPTEPPAKPKPPATNSQLPALPTGPKVSWLKRDRNAPMTKMSEDIWDEFNEAEFTDEIQKKFAHLSLHEQKKTIRWIMAYATYEKDKKKKQDFGTVRQFLVLLKCAFTTQMDRNLHWEIMFRHVRLLDDLIKRKIPKDTRNLSTRLRALLLNLALPIYQDLGWKIMPGEHESDTLMRFFIVRVLLWLDYPEVIIELSRQSDLPLDQLESPIRAVVFAFIARNKNNAEELKAKYWESAVVADPKDPAADKFGTIRQHVLFGLMTARDASKAGTPIEFKFMRDTFSSLWSWKDIPSSPVPMDLHWAFFGATDNMNSAKTALDVYRRIPYTCDVYIPEQFKVKNKDVPAAAAEKIKEQWRNDLLGTCDLMAECCGSRAEYDNIVCKIGAFDTCLDGMISKVCQDTSIFEDRTSNLDRLFEDKKTPTVIDEALKRIEG